MSMFSFNSFSMWIMFPWCIKAKICNLSCSLLQSAVKPDSHSLFTSLHTSLIFSTLSKPTTCSPASCFYLLLSTFSPHFPICSESEEDQTLCKCFMHAVWGLTSEEVDAEGFRREGNCDAVGNLCQFQAALKWLVFSRGPCFSVNTEIWLHQSGVASPSRTCEQRWSVVFIN